MHEKAAQGIWPCQAPAGYRNVTLASGKKGIEPDPDTAPIVTKLFEWYTTGNYSLAEIADLATDSGLKFGRSRNLAATVHNLFKNPTVEFRQPFDLIAVGAAELKQMKAAGADSDDLHQFKYT